MSNEERNLLIEINRKLDLLIDKKATGQKDLDFVSTQSNTSALSEKQRSELRTRRRKRMIK
jgi:hypothetical protein